MRRTLIVLGVALAALSRTRDLQAQVGYEPRRSPFRDLEETQEITLYTGYFHAREDPAHVAPQSGPLVGAHYQWRAGGPAHFTFDVSRAASQRRVLDPERSCAAPAGPDCRLVATYRWPMYFFDGGQIGRAHV